MIPTSPESRFENTLYSPMTTEYVRHLWKASHALAITSPAVSAHLMARLLEQLPVPANHACAACGTIIIPGLNCHVHTSNKHIRKRKTSNGPKAATKQKEATPRQSRGYRARGETSNLRVIYECQTCGRGTTQEAPRAKRKSANRVRSGFASENPGSLPAADVVSSTIADVRPSPKYSAPMPSQNAGSKKRTKSRKGNSLSDILAKKKQDSSRGGGRGNGVGGFGLDLMDLMKTG